MSTSPFITLDASFVTHRGLKQAMVNYAPEIKDLIEGKQMNPNLKKLAIHLVAYAFPHHENLLPRGYNEKALDFYKSDNFTKLFKPVSNLTLDELIEATR